VNTVLLPTNARILEFQILDHLGSGGFANTYLALDENLNKKVAIKEFFPRRICERGEDYNVRPTPGNESSFRTYLAHFLHEAQILAKFDEENIVKVLRYFEGLGTAFIIMEFVEGRQLDDFIKETDFLNEETVESWIEGILTGLQAVHANDVIHGDIKPKNIIIDQYNKPVLIDFGASVIYQTGRANNEQYDEILVSPNYAAPEQLDRGGDIDRRIDIYALGAVFYEVITREKFVRDSSGSAKEILNYGKYYNIKLLRSVERALKEKPNERFEQCEDWLFFLTLTKRQKLGRYLKRRKWTFLTLLFLIAFSTSAANYLIENEVDEKNYRYKLFSSQTLIDEKLREGASYLEKLDGAATFLAGYTSVLTSQIQQLDDRHLVTGRTNKGVLSTSLEKINDAADRLRGARVALAELRRRYYFDDYPPYLREAQKTYEMLDVTLERSTRNLFAIVIEHEIAKQSVMHNQEIDRDSLSSLLQTILNTETSMPIEDVATRAQPVIEQFLLEQASRNKQKNLAALKAKAKEEAENLYRAYKGRSGRKDLEAVTDKIASAQSQQEIDLYKREASEIVKRIENDRRLAVVRQQKMKRENKLRSYIQGIEARMVQIPGGSFLMGGYDHMYARPTHLVTVKKFWLAKTEVTVSQWARCVAEKNCRAIKDNNGGDYPVTNVTWDDTQKYVNWINKRSKALRFRLPSEAEWEYVAKKYGFKVKELESKLERVSVDQLNARNINSLLGNALEWLDDCWHGGYRNAPTDGASWDEGLECNKRVVRGSNWEGEYTLTRTDATYFRPYGIEKDSQKPTLGFRLAADRR